MASDDSDSSDCLQKETVALTTANHLTETANELFTFIMDDDFVSLKTNLRNLSIGERKNFINGQVQCHDTLNVSYTPLQLACCMGNRKIAHFLISKGADVTTVNIHGKNVIHTLVDIAKYRPETAVCMYRFIMKLISFRDKKELLDTRYEKCPPHLYAVKNGHLRMADAIIHTDDIYRHILNRCGTYHVIRYDIHIKGTQPHECPIRALLQLGLDQVKTPENRDVILQRPWATWLSRSWSEYAWIAFLWFLVRLVHLVLLTICCVYRPIRMSRPGTNFTIIHTHDPNSYGVVYGISYLLLFYACVAIASNLFRLIRPSSLEWIANWCLSKVRNFYTTVQRIKKPNKTHLTQGKLFWGWSVMMHVTYALSFIFSHYGLDIEDTVLSLSVLLCYLSMLFFCTLIPQLGHFSIIIEQTVKDILNFALFYIFILLGFSAAFYTLYQMEDVEEFASYHRTVFTVFRMTFDVVDMDTLKRARAHVAAIVCFIIYIVIVVIALFNFLIAILSQTVSDITESRHIAFCLNRASVAFFLQDYPLVRSIRMCVLSVIRSCCSKHIDLSDGLCSVTNVEHVSEDGMNNSVA